MSQLVVRGIALHEGKLLAVRLKPYDELAASGGVWWCLPGGKVDEGEPVNEAVVREVYEETGINPSIGKLLYVYQLTFKGKERLEFFFHITNPEDYFEIDLDGTSHGAIEIDEIDFVDPKQVTVLPDFLASEDLEHQIKPEAPVKFFSSVKE